MPIRFQCWQCRKHLSITTRKAGTMIPCPICGTTQTVPASPDLATPTSLNTADEFVVPFEIPDDGVMGVVPPAPAFPPAPAAPPAPSPVPAAAWWTGSPPAESVSAVPPPASPVPPPAWSEAPFDSEAAAPSSGRAFQASLGIVVLLALLGTTGVVIYALVNLGGDKAGTRPPTVAQKETAGQPKAVPQPVDARPEVPAPGPGAAPEKDNEIPAPKVGKGPPDAEVKPVPPPDVERPRKKVPDEPPPAVKPQPEEKKPEAAPEKQPEAPAKVTLKRRSSWTAEELRQQLMLVREIALDAPHAPLTSRDLLQLARANPDIQALDLAPQIMLRRADLAGLQVNMGLACRLGKEPAETLQALSGQLRRHLEACIPGASSGTVADTRPDPEKLRARLIGDAQRSTWLRPESIPTLLQLLMAENRDVRMVLVEILSRIKGREASDALARRALVDLDADVREAALNALKERPREEYEMVLLSGFQYPWPAVAEHAAEAVVALKMSDCTSKLVHMLDAKDISRPFCPNVKNPRVAFVRELVRINHLGNCIMCHAPSFKRGDLVRGRVPIPGEELPAPVTTPKYYEGDRGIFVRADITYLKQDFSVHQPVLQPRTWPNHQRFDYMVRLRRLTPQEVAIWHKGAKLLNPISPRKEALMFALRELTHKNPGPLVQDWRRLYDPITGVPLAKPITPREEVLQLRTAIVDAAPKKQVALLEAFREREGGVYDTALAQSIPELSTGIQEKAREVLLERMIWVPLKELRQGLLHQEPEVRRAAVLACAAKELPTMIEDVKACLNDVDPGVKAAANAALSRLDTSYAPDTEVQRLKTALTEARPEAMRELLEGYREGKGTVFSLALAKALPDLPTNVQKLAREVLTERLTMLPLEEFRGKLRDKDREMRYAAVLACKQKRVKSVIPDLIPRLDDRDPVIVYNARKALEQLVGQDIGPRPEATATERAQIIRFWQDWWKKQSNR